MFTNVAKQSDDDLWNHLDADFPGILIISNDARAAESYRQKLTDAGLAVMVAIGFAAVQDLSYLQELSYGQRSAVMLLDVADIRAVDTVVAVAISIKRRDPAQFVGYLADPILRTSGLAGDAIFDRSAAQLAQAIRAHFALKT